MKRDWLIRGLVALLLSLGLLWLWSATEWVQTQVKQPLQGEAASDNSYAAEALLKRLGSPVFKQAAVLPMPPPQSRLVLVPHYPSLTPAQDHAIQAWVEAGGHLLMQGQGLMSDDGPDWLPVREETEELVGFSGDDAKEPTQTTATLLDEVKSRCRSLDETGDRSLAYGQGRSLQICAHKSYALTTTRDRLWSLGGEAGTELLRVAVGRGTVTVIGPRDLFGNHYLLHGDNALAMVAALQLRQGDPVYFITSAEVESLLPWLWHRAWVALLLAALALGLALWRKAQRFGPVLPPPVPGRRSLGEQVRGTAQFLHQHGGQALRLAQCKALERAAKRRLPGYALLDALGRARALADATGQDALALHQAMDVARPLPRKDLARSLALLERALRLLKAQTIPSSPE
mgnify:CR=1 FL=1